MAYEDWWNIFQVVGVALVALTFTVGALGFFTGFKTRQEKDRKAAEQRERIAQLTKDAETLKNETANANERTAKLELEIAEAKRKQAEAEKSLLDVKQKVQWKPFSTQHRARLKGNLWRSPKRPISILFFEGIEETETLAKEITEFFVVAAWEVLGCTGNKFFEIPPKGLTLFSPTLDDPSAVAIKKVFASVGIEITITADSRRNPDLILVVGTKP